MKEITLTPDSAGKDFNSDVTVSFPCILSFDIESYDSSGYAYMGNFIVLLNEDSYNTVVEVDMDLGWKRPTAISALAQQKYYVGTQNNKIYARCVSAASSSSKILVKAIIFI